MTQQKPEGKCFSQTKGAYLHDGAIVVEVPAEVEVLDADTAGVGAGQQDCAAIHSLQEGNLPHRHLQGLSRPHTLGEEQQKTQGSGW